MDRAIKSNLKGSFLQRVLARDMVRLIAFVIVLSTVRLTPSMAVENGLLPGKTDAISQRFLGPMKSDFMIPSELQLRYEESSIDNANGEKLRLWTLPASDAQQTIVFCMGNQGNISSHLAYAKILVDGGFNVVMFDYQGYGGSSGVASALSLYSDASRVVEHLMEKCGLSPKDIGIFGVSLGSVLAVAMAAEYDLGAVAVEDILLPQKKLHEISGRLPNDFASKIAIGTLRNVILPKVDPIANAKRLHCPLFLMHGEHDELLPPSGSIELAQAATVPVRLWLMDDAGHAPETLEIYDGEYAVQLQSFFEEAFAGRLDVPTAKFEASQEGDQWNVRIDIDCRKSGAYQIALASDDGRYHFVRKIVDGEMVFNEVVAFKPTHLSVVMFHEVDQSSDGNWTFRKTDRSSSLHLFRQFESQVAAHCPIRTRMSIFYGILRPTNFLLPEDLKWIEANLPQCDDVQSEIRPRYARLLANIFANLDPADQYEHIEFSNLIIPFVPEHPDRYVQLDNASFELQFRDDTVAGCLVLLAKHLFERGQLESTKALLNRAYAVSRQTWPTASAVESLQLGADFYKCIGSPHHRKKTQAK